MTDYQKILVKWMNLPAASRISLRPLEVRLFTSISCPLTPTHCRHHIHKCLGLQAS